MTVTVMAGIAESNASLFRRLQVPLGDPAAWINLDGRKIALVRDIEMDRVREHAQSDMVTCPAEYAPADGLSPDRETATAQAVVELLRGEGVKQITADRSLPFIYAWHLNQGGIEVAFDANLGVVDRRAKTDVEIEALAKAQGVTEQVMQMLCETIAQCPVAADGTLLHEQTPLSSERLRAIAAIEFLKQGFTMAHGAIVATAPQVADCHHSGSGNLKTAVPIVIDLFPRDESSRYWGDCTRTIVHGEPSDTVRQMHEAVVAAKAAAQSWLRPGNTADAVHQAAEQVLRDRGYENRRGTVTDEPSIQHGTGHGVGLDLHEPILLDSGGGEMLDGEVFTVEPGLYGRHDGGVRVEDMLVVTPAGPRNLNRLHEGLDWRL